jgi:hypothetical protein
MLATTHVAFGAAVAAALPTSPPGAAAGFTLGVISHLVLDVVPHWGTDDDNAFIRVARADGFALLAVGLIVTAYQFFNGGVAAATVGVATMFGALLFDLDKPFRHFFGVELWPEPLAGFLGRIQTEASRFWPVDVTTAFIALATWSQLV